MKKVARWIGCDVLLVYLLSLMAMFIGTVIGWNIVREIMDRLVLSIVITWKAYQVMHTLMFMHTLMCALGASIGGAVLGTPVGLGLMMLKEKREQRRKE